MQRIWYVAYGSNLATARFRCYLSGGRPAGGSRDYVGCRDPSDPTRIEGVEVPGGLVFAGASRVWHGGMAFYDRAAPGVVAGCAYLVTTEQFADVAAQELRRPPGGEFAHDLSGLLPDVESVVTTGPGLYETVVRLGELRRCADVHDHPSRRREPGSRGSDGGVPALDRGRSARGTRLRRRPDRPLPRRRPGGAAARGPRPRSRRWPRPDTWWPERSGPARSVRVAVPLTGFAGGHPYPCLRAAAGSRQGSRAPQARGAGRRHRPHPARPRARPADLAARPGHRRPRPSGRRSCASRTPSPS